MSCLEYNGKKTNEASMTRVRCVARKRYPLALDLVTKFKRNSGSGHSSEKTSNLSFVGHTRFATSSVNIESELHPHEWVPFHEEVVWLFEGKTGHFRSCKRTVGLHLSHNGDFDALNCYNQIMVVGDVGLWLERVLDVKNSTSGDSPKVAGMMDLMRVQGRWGPAARLAYVRCILTCPNDVSGEEGLSKEAPSVFPGWDHWLSWEKFFTTEWENCRKSIIVKHKEITPGVIDNELNTFRYSIDTQKEKEMVKALCGAKNKPKFLMHGKEHKPASSELKAFMHMAVRGFLRADLYTALTEFMIRAEGSFGIQVHCSLEPAVMCIASKGQPMAVAFDRDSSICLTGSEANALAVPVTSDGKWLTTRIDLDNKGEIMRIGGFFN